MRNGPSRSVVGSESELVRKKLNPGANGIENDSSVSEHAAQTNLINSLP